MMRSRFLNGVRILAGFLLCTVADIATAQQATQAQIGAIKQSCRSDYQSYCSSVPTGGSAALQCLQGHMANLSPPCQTAVGAMGGTASTGAAPTASQAAPQSAAPHPAMPMREEAGMMRRSCGRDFRTYCQGVTPGGGHGMACLAENEARLSPGCRGALAEARGLR
jgi:hypothetical protein